MLIRSGDIHGESRKLSKIAKNFGQFFCRHKFLGAGVVKMVPNLSPLPRGASTGKSPVKSHNLTSPEVIESNRLNFSLARFLIFTINFFFGGGPYI